MAPKCCAASARAAGFDDDWTKPIDLSSFLGVIDRLMPTR